jgi:hypothetical protein
VHLAKNATYELALSGRRKKGSDLAGAKTVVPRTIMKTMVKMPGPRIKDRRPPKDCIVFDRAHFRDIFPAFSRD